LSLRPIAPSNICKRARVTIKRKAARAMRRLIGLLWFAALLTGCSTIMGPSDPPPPEKAPEPLPNARQILANSTDVLFDSTANPQNVGIGELRHFDTVLGPQYGVCLRATVSSRQSKTLSTVVYVVIFDRNKVADRRRALAADGCDREKYQPYS
jgi:hypothetical protein